MPISDIDLDRKCPTYYEIYNMDVREKCGLTVTQLEKGLNGELKSLAQNYLDAEEKYGINAVFLSAVDAVESGWGKYCHTPNNISGFYTNKYFSSKAECIDYVTMKKKVWYFTNPETYYDYDLAYKYTNGNMYEVGMYYNGYTISDFSKYYNPSNPLYDQYITQICYEIYYNSLK